MKRKVILVDLDNVVYDWAGTMAKWLAENGAVPSAEWAMRLYSNWEVWDDWGIPKGEFLRWWRLGIEAGEVYAKGDVIGGARHALWILSDQEWDIHIATSRLTKFGLHDQIVINTANWLKDNNIPYRNIHFTDNKTAIKADAIIDDRADNMTPSMHVRTFLFPANHNQKGFVRRIDQATAWKGIVETLVTKTENGLPFEESTPIDGGDTDSEDMVSESAE